MIILEQLLGDLTGSNAVVIDASTIVGKPMAAMLLEASCSVTVLHKYSQDIPSIAATTDILVVAAGQPQMVKRDWVKPGTVVLDGVISTIPLAWLKTINYWEVTSPYQFEAIVPSYMESNILPYIGSPSISAGFGMFRAVGVEDCSKASLSITIL